MKARAIRLSHRTKILFSFGVFLILIVVSNGLSYWSAEQSEYHFKRSQLAHKALKTNLQISNNTYRLFKVYTNEIVVENLEYGNLLNTLLEAINTDLKILKLIIADEVRLVGDKENEGEELLLVAQIERKIDTLVREFNEVILARQSGLLDVANQKLAQLIQKGIDQEFNRLITQAIEEEQSEVIQTDLAAALVTRRLEIMNISVAVISIPLAIWLLYMLLASFGEAISKLMQGAKRFKNGDLDYTIPSMTEQEFDLLGKRFNQMAAEIKLSREQIIAAKDSLEVTVSERTHALKIANNQLTITDQARRRLFTDISHELRTPLTVIRGEAEISLRGEDKSVENYKASLRRIVDQAAHTSSLVDDILFIARKDAGETRLKLVPIDIVNLVVKHVTDFKSLALAKSLFLKSQIKNDGAVVMGDEGRLRQVFSILLDNAIRYSNKNGEIRILVNRVSNGVRISIEDDGIGIDEKDLPRIFERFYRGDNAVRVADGSGLGLPVAKAIVEAHNGTLSIQSNKNTGVVATVVLPTEDKIRAVK